jgi:hypothetical protein
MVAATGVLVAAAYYVMNMRATLLTRQAQLFMGIYQEQYSKDMLDADINGSFNIEIRNLDDYNTLAADPEKFKSWYMWQGYLKGIGVLVEEKLVDVRLVNRLMGGQVMWCGRSMGLVLRILGRS